MNNPDPPALILKTYLDSIGFFSTQGPGWPRLWTSYASSLADDPDYAVSITNCKGKNFGRLMRGGTPEHFGVDIRIRSGLDWSLGHRMGNALHVLADAISEPVGNVIPAPPYVLVNQNRYLIQSMYRNTEQLIDMGEEPGNKRRQMFSMSVRLVLCWLGSLSPISYTSNPDPLSVPMERWPQDWLSSGQPGILNSQIICYC